MYHFIDKKKNYSMAKSDCRKLGYDGLAVISSSEISRRPSRNAVVKENSCGMTGQMWHPICLGLLFNMCLAPTKPVEDYEPMESCSDLRYAVCGHHSYDFVEATGQILRSSKPVFNESMILAQYKMESHLY
ncbi:hypothetical protein RRG08_046735 [Elysia crispata]|uniref:C-type lectin domain-containing protein n=1 Tax=Elysia crispata TaxID=231223 RepID=A0AAE1DNM8_9GAST|nr:hypothetical protein RRG08_046735 [Elysia crispata]